MGSLCAQICALGKNIIEISSLCLSWTQAGQDGVTGPGVAGGLVPLRPQAPDCHTTVPMKAAAAQTSWHTFSSSKPCQVHYLTVPWSEAQQDWLVSLLWAPKGQNQGVGLAVFCYIPTWALGESAHVVTLFWLAEPGSTRLYDRGPYFLAGCQLLEGPGTFLTPDASCNSSSDIYLPFL